MKFVRPTLCALAALAAAACILTAGCTPKKSGNVLARVGDREITVADFQAELKFRTANRQPIPDRQTLLEQMIARETLVQQARAAGLANAADVRRTVDDVLIAKLKETRLTPQLDAVKISPEEIRAAYGKEIARFTQPAKVQLAFVFIAVDPKANTNQLAGAEARVAEARRLAQALPAGSRGFAQVAADFSDDQITRYRGGDAGWFTADSIADRWPKAVIAAGFALPNAGDISGVLRAPEGFYLVKKLDARAAVVAPLALAQPVVERRLLAEKRARIEQEFQKQVRAAVAVQTDAAALAAVAYPTQNIAKAAELFPPASPSSH
ncbi:MAG: peptidylprolyl isomerase [Verrucomicrobia bacterium]|nr:peptidylprolyl isomerase [Verrucomicrobiota bacterium]